MNADMHAFVAEVAAHPMFLAALKADPNCAGRLEKMESNLRDLYERGGGNAHLIELFDAARLLSPRARIASCLSTHPTSFALLISKQTFQKQACIRRNTLLPEQRTYPRLDLPKRRRP
jgi:hypothetical protein